MLKFPNFDDTAVCRQIDTDLMFTEPADAGDTKRERRAFYDGLKAFCKTCPFLSECSEWSLHHEEYGVWGATTAKERITIRRQLGVKLVEPSPRQFSVVER